MIEWGEADLPSVVDDRLGRSVDERHQILHPVARRLGSFRLEIFHVADLANQLLNQNVDTRVLRAFAQVCNEASELCQRLSRGRTQRLLEILTRGDFRD